MAPMTQSLAGKTTLVTGASSGIGLAIAKLFYEAGSSLIMAARNAEKLHIAADLIADPDGPRITAIPTDLTDDSQLQSLFETAAAQKLDILINNAGASIRARTEHVTPAAWRGVIDLNVTAAFLAAQAAFKIFLEQDRPGRIINIGSVSARVPRHNSVAYTTSKFALDGMSRAMALDGRGKGIAVSILHPGNTESAIWTGQEDAVAKEGLMPGASVARAALLMATLPPDINLLDATMLPLTMPFLGRG
jgi:NAD(P)-dependent dehydrogenase (short-subunit alcohol dehydrogenase family)